ncbi:MAG: glycosyltransferase [Candidatus Tectomicrobia bacterium]|nr:glycosyltransferase [Candidatus Tectomicrobia bacterium]
MRCPTLSELPPPPPGRAGWPWTEESPQLPDAMPDGSPWPRVSIVTPSLNQGRFIEETIRSVLLQGYPNLEYLIIDGGSTDESVEIIKKYEKHLAHWVSEPDKGQAYAINKGWRLSSGTMIGWLNSDDLLTPCSIHDAVAYLHTHPMKLLVYGNSCCINVRSHLLRNYRARPFRLTSLRLSAVPPIWQPGVLMQREVLKHAGLLDETLHVALDSEYWIRLAVRDGGLGFVPRVLSCHRSHDLTKTRTLHARKAIEIVQILESYFKQSDIPESMSRVQRESLGRAYLLAAQIFDNGILWRSRSRAYLLRALRLHWKVLSPRLCLLFAKSFLPARMLRLMRSVHATLRAVSRQSSEARLASIPDEERYLLLRAGKA